MTKKNIHTETHELYKVESGVKADSPDLGECYYKVTCGDNSGFAYYEDGEHILNARKISIEKVGTDAQSVGKGHNDTQTFAPAKIILAESGDIYFEARGGDIIMKGNNILMVANGSENDEGHILLSATNRLIAEGSDVDMQSFSGSFKITAKTGLSIKGGNTLIGGSSIDIQEGLTSSPTEFVSSILTGDLFSPTKFLKIFTNFLTGSN